ncbi:hypothetical protein [Streptomyces sp. NPDC006551]|uniref:hypothetical protein n=1 Tax=Streptomyces sp. NPDC006551 TaxID=3157178 RepID=UPI0033A6BDA1
MDASRNDSGCGLCGQALSTQHDQHGDGSMTGVGKRVEYVVVELRGALARYQAAGDLSQTDKTVAAGLAEELGIGLVDLVGCRFTCWETPAEYGVIQSGFKLV